MLNMITTRPDPLAVAIKALREGVASEQQWRCATKAVAQASCHQNGVRGTLGHIQAAAAALQRIRARAMVYGGTWVPQALHFQELDALQTFMDLHDLQTTQPTHAPRRGTHHHFERLAA